MSSDDLGDDIDDLPLDDPRPIKPFPPLPHEKEATSDPFDDFDDDDFDDEFDDDFEEEWDEELPGDVDQFPPDVEEKDDEFSDDPEFDED